MHDEEIKIREIDRHVIEKYRIPVLEARPRENRRTRMNHDGDSELLGLRVKGINQGIVGIVVLVGWIKLETPAAQILDCTLQFPDRVGSHLGVAAGKGNRRYEGT